MFDVAETRRALQARRSELLAECTANSKLQRRFDQIAFQLQSTAQHSTSQQNQQTSDQEDDLEDSDQAELDSSNSNIGINRVGSIGSGGGMGDGSNEPSM